MGRRASAERKESADPRSGVLELLELGEVYLPLPPPPWAPRRQPLAPIGVKTLYTYIGSTLWPLGTKFCHAGRSGPLWAPFSYFGERWAHFTYSWGINFFY